ncbi:MAG TPA: hypothetical protein VNU68_30720 [Verrucomicrobiae bacterium]|nr:hypothetical protein [Verrucomicrobiae bacterium]
MNDVPQPKLDQEPPSLGVADVYFVLFRQKWLVLAGLCLGILAATVLYKLRPPLFQSTAKIMVQYVRDSQSAVVNLGPGSQVRAPIPGGGNALASEGEILTSLDVAQDAAEAVGLDRVVPHAGPEAKATVAAFYIRKHVKVEISPQIDVITIESEHESPEVAQEILEKLIEAYLKKHHTVHDTVGGSEDAYGRQRDQLRAAVANCDAELKALRTSVGVSSLEEFRKANAVEESRVRQALGAAEADLAQAMATLDELEAAASPTNLVGVASMKEPPQSKVREYNGLLTSLEQAKQAEQEMSRRLTKESPLVQANSAQIEQLQRKQKEMEREFPAFLRGPITPAVPMTQFGPAMLEQRVTPAQIRGLEARTNALSKQLADVQAQAKRVDEVELRLLKLQRDRERFEAQLTAIESALQQRKFTQALGNTPNIQPVQRPSLAARDFMKLYKTMGLAVAGFLGLAIGLAFFIELVLDRSLRRPKDLEGLLGMPLLLSIPRLVMPSTRALANRAEAGPKGVPLETVEVMKPFHDALRDRLVNYFEIRQMNHKPKMIAVTGCDEQAGVSSVASGLAGSLSEIGEGNVLLVDMRGKGAAHAFFRGKEACGLEQALEDDSRNEALVQENLYVVSGSSADRKIEEIVPRHFSEFIPKLKASDYEYIIFDMPPVSPTSLTAKVSRFMDMVLMVVEAGKTSRDVAVRAAALLAESKAIVAPVLNKRRRYVPRWLLQEFD